MARVVYRHRPKVRNLRQAVSVTTTASNVGVKSRSQYRRPY